MRRTKMTDNKKSKLIILTAGGTGGHVYPAEALAQELSQRGYRLMLITDKRGQNNYHGKLGEIENRAVLSGALVGKGKWFKIKSLIKTSLGILQSMWIIARRRPHCIVGFGGYASFPCSMAAILLGKNLILHEQNSVMSRTNRFLAKYATAVATSFSKTKYAPSGRRVTQTGMPVRSSISDLFTQQYTPSTGNRIFNLIILGGSQGAKVFGDVVPAAVKMLDNKTQKRLRITQQCRADDVKSIEKSYQKLACKSTVSNFFNNMPELYSSGHLIISRAGASSVSEIAAVGIPSILVPLPTAADDHQTSNAAEFKTHRGGLVFSQKEFTPEKLASTLNHLINTPDELVSMSTNTKKFAIIDADKRLADLVEKIIRRG